MGTARDQDRIRQVNDFVRTVRADTRRIEWADGAGFVSALLTPRGRHVEAHWIRCDGTSPQLTYGYQVLTDVDMADVRRFEPDVEFGVPGDGTCLDDVLIGAGSGMLEWYLANLDLEDVLSDRGGREEVAFHLAPSEGLLYEHLTRCSLDALARIVAAGRGPAA